MKSKPRVLWVDAAKGLCILLVVMGHAITELNAHGYYTWLWEDVNFFLGPIRMPLFFMLSGLFAGKALKESWYRLADRRIWVMVWLYVIWVPVRDLVIFLLPYTRVEASGIVYPPGVMDQASWIPKLYNTFHAAVEPTSYLWFLWALALFAILTRATRSVPPVIQILAAGAFSAWAPFEPVSWSWDFVTKMYVFYLVGMYGARLIFHVVHRWKLAFLVATFVAFASVATWVQLTYASFNDGNIGLTRVYLSLTGALFGIGLMATLQGSKLVVPFEKLGKRTLPVFLMHIPMLIITMIVMDLVLSEDPHLALLTPAVTVLAAFLCLGMHKLLLASGAWWLFKRPQWFIRLTTPYSHQVGQAPRKLVDVAENKKRV